MLDFQFKISRRFARQGIPGQPGIGFGQLFGVQRQAGIQFGHGRAVARRRRRGEVEG